MITVFESETIASLARGIVDEMQVGLFRSGYSSIIRESHDASCAILTADGSLVAQKVVLPIHIGAFPAVVSGVLAHYSSDQIFEGDIFLSNSPWEGGSPHSPDFAVAIPVFFDNLLVAFTASIAHKTDIGGAAPGSCPAAARDTFFEGLHVPPVKIIEMGAKNKEVFDLLKGNTRTPDLILGDLEGQIGVCSKGAVRVKHLFNRFGLDMTLSSFINQRQITRDTIKNKLRSIIDFEGNAERFIDHDGIDLGTPKGIRVFVAKSGDTITFDFSDSDSQGAGPINVRPHLVKAACSYVMIAITGRDTPINQGVFDCFDVKTREGTIVDPFYPAPVNTYNPALHAIIESIFAAFGESVPHLARADGGGGRAMTLAHVINRKIRIQYELFAGGVGAMQGYDGESGCHCNQTNGKIASIEMLETEFPVRTEEFKMLEESGGAGAFKGGNGFKRTYRILNGTTSVTLRSSKHGICPKGVNGGCDAYGGFCEAEVAGKKIILASMQSGVTLKRGDTLSLGTPGGGGFGLTERKSSSC